MSTGFKIYFFMGKGGVGKTTCAAAYALRMSRRGCRTFIVSLDPAHNLGDVFDLRIGEEPTRISENLYALEIDFDKLVLDHLKELSERIKDIYGYLRILNLDRYIDTLRHSPGVEEYAVLEKIIDIVEENMHSRAFDVIIFDTPPTGLTLRIMALPRVSLIWVEKLMELRLRILERRRAICRIAGEELKAVIGGKEIKLPIDAREDPVYKELIKIHERVKRINDVLCDSDVTSVYMVINPELLPIYEAHRACTFLNRLGIPIKAVIVNKVIYVREVPGELRVKIRHQEESLKKAKELFKNVRLIEIPLLPIEPRGIRSLEVISKYLEGL